MLLVVSVDGLSGGAADAGSSDASAIDVATAERLATEASTTASFIEQEVGAAGAAWNIIGTVSLNDSNAERITTPGSVGFSAAEGDPTNIFSYDDFTRTPL